VIKRATLAALAISVVALSCGAAALAIKERGRTAPLPDTGQVVVGHSVNGAPIVAHRFGDLSSPNKALVVGDIHGDEPAGIGVLHDVKKRLRGAAPNFDLWLIDTVNPDGLAAHTRKNAHGVDLNRNFSVGWRGGRGSGDGYYPGPRPFSEPESRAVRDLVLKLKPAVSIWFHQPWGQTLAPCRGPIPLERLFARRSGVPLNRCRAQHLPGTAIRFENAKVGGNAFVVEFPGGSLGATATKRAANATLAVVHRAFATSGEKRWTVQRKSQKVRRGPLDKLKPPIQDMLIPFPPKRKREMANYSKHHYGQHEWRLRKVQTVVEHYTVTNSVSATYNTFAPDVPDGEFHELPNTCAHFVIGSNGRIYRFVPLSIRCRHTVGLNYTAVGIEHVGSSDQQILSNPRQMRASLELTRWLRCRYGLQVKQVIGHNESLSSPYYKELDPRFQGQTHGDWNHRDMQNYRHQLRALGGC